jgi:acetyltransferase-like isoleucine patch superfamily enzyme
MRDALKAAAHAIATLVVLPVLLSYAVRAAMFGSDRALEGSTQALSLIPGLPGQYVRRAFLARVLKGGFAWTATVEFGTIFSQTGARIEGNVYIGSRCHLGLVHIERDVLLASGVHIPSGRYAHGTDPSLPIRHQQGHRHPVRIGAGSWIGSNAVVMADVGRETIVGAGAVVTRPLPDRVVAAGVPAQVVRRRDDVPAVNA